MSIDAYRSITLDSEQSQIVSYFNVTQQLGFKPVLHCRCGASLDLNINPKRTLQAFKLAHETCQERNDERWL